MHMDQIWVLVDLPRQKFRLQVEYTVKTSATVKNTFFQTLLKVTSRPFSAGEESFHP